MLIGLAGLALPLLLPAAAWSAAPDATTANAPTTFVSGSTVTVFVPFASDNHLRNGAAEAVLESSLGALPSPIFLHTGFTNSCAVSETSGEAVCSGLFGRSFAIHPPSTRVSPFSTGARGRIHFTGGDCTNCGVAMDDGLGLAIIATDDGYLPLQLSPQSLLPMISTNGEAISGQFGYDPVNHRILSPNYRVLEVHHFTTGPPHFQIIDVGGTPQLFDLANDQAFFNNGNTCNGGTHGMIARDVLPDSGAIDTTTNIAYVSFRSRSDCTGPNAVEDIGLFDLSQATFTPGTPSGTWDTPGKQIETLSELQAKFANGLTGIAIASAQHLAVIADRREGSGGTTGFGALRVPSTSGSGVPAIVDWVQADMPNDPAGKPWQMSFMPNGVTAYTSPNTGRAMGVVMNEARTFVAVVDLEGLLDAMRAPGTSHTLDPSVDLVGTGIVRFVGIRPHK